jgi:hypothetical protein
MAALVLLLLVAAALKSLFAGRGGVGAYACYVPKNASFVACFDAAALRDCAVLERMGPSAEGLRKQVAPRLSDLNLEESQVAEIFVAGRPLGDPIVVIRASKGVDLAALPTGADTKVKTHRGIPYRCQRTEAGTCWVAQTGRSTYCFAPDEGEMAETLARLSRREKPVLSRDLRRVLKEVCQEEHYIAGSPQGTFPWARTAGLGLSFGATLRVRAVMIFPDEHAAGQFEKVIAAGRQQAIQRGRKAIAEADSAQKEALERAVAVLEGIKVNSKADAVLITAACLRNDVLGMAESAAGGLEETGDRMMRTLMKGTPQE